MWRDTEWLGWLIPVVYLLGVIVALRRRHAWPALTLAARAALGFATCHLLAIGTELRSASATVPLVAAVVMLLVAFLGWIIAGYSRTSLAREPGERRYVVALLATLAAVTVVLTTENLLVLIAAWAASSVTVHQLLVFYRDRPLARIAARKKFLVSRVAELCMLAATALLYHRWQTLDLDALARLAGTRRVVPVSVDLAAALIALAVLLKSAQLPVHGWLLEVMEAPTSVSALLHAGIVNLGGYVLIRLAPLVTTSPAAQAILVLVGSTTAVLAGLTTMTCPSIKTRLAWSTCSQMGLMVTECGLGLYDLALLHLLAHALYKAHAFLCSGETVRQSAAKRMLPPAQVGAEGAGKLRPLIAAPLMLLVVAGSEALWHHVLHVPKIAGVAALICAFGIATLLWESGGSAALYLRNLGAAVLGVQLYLGWHAAILSGLGVASVRPLQPLAAWTALCFLLLYLAQWGAGHRAHSASIRRLFTWAAAGYFLDEPLTRLVTRRWSHRPARVVHSRTAHRLARQEGEAA